jgi:hypothetical protein
MMGDTGPGVKSKASTKLIEGIAKHPGGWDWVKSLSQTMVEVSEIIQGTNWLRSNYSTLKLYLWLVGAESASRWARPPVHPSPYQTACPGLRPTTHIVELHLVILVRGLLFVWEVRCFSRLFRCLLLKCLCHPNEVISVTAPLAVLHGKVHRDL